MITKYSKSKSEAVETMNRDDIVSTWYEDMNRMAIHIANLSGIKDRFDEFLPYAEDALIYSAENFRSDGGSAFHSFLYANIRFWCGKFRRDNDFSMKHHQQWALEIRRASKEIGCDWGDGDYREQIAAKIGVKVSTLDRRIQELSASENLKRFSGLVESLDNPKESLDERRFIDNQATARIEETVNAMDDQKIVAGLMEKLTDREKLVINQIIFAERTLEDVGTELGVTRERVRQIKLAALNKIHRQAINMKRI